MNKIKDNKRLRELIAKQQGINERGKEILGRRGDTKEGVFGILMESLLSGNPSQDALDLKKMIEDNDQNTLDIVGTIRKETMTREREIFMALYNEFDKSGTYHNMRSRHIFGGAVYIMGSNKWKERFYDFDDENIATYEPYKRLNDHTKSGKLKDGDILTCGEGYLPVIKGKTLEIAKRVMKESFGLELLDSFVIGVRAYYLWVGK